MTTHYEEKIINNRVLKTLSEGRSTNDAQDLFISMNMANDCEGIESYVARSPSVDDIYWNLIGNGTIDDKDIKRETYTGRLYNGTTYQIPRLVVRIAPGCVLYIENVHDTLHITVNNKSLTVMTVRCKNPGDMALWIIRQKKRLEEYLGKWAVTLVKISKKVKGINMATLAIKAIFNDAMKDYPNVKYQFIEQKRRVRIRVKFPNSKLGVIIDAWWGTYKERLPKQIEDLKVLINAHSKVGRMDFFVSKD